MMLLPPYLFPPVYWFVKAQQLGEMRVGLGGFFQKQTLRSRYTIAGPNKLQTLSVPILHTGDKKLLADTGISHAEKWAKEHAHAWKSAYGKAPFYEFYDYRFLPAIQQNNVWLIEMIQDSITQLHSALKLEIPLIFEENVAMDLEMFETAAFMQVFDDRFGFRQPVSALDLVFNLGPEAEDYIVQQAQLLP